MKILGCIWVASIVVFGCTIPKSNQKLKPPTINWTALDEPPLFSDCPTETPSVNWHCFTNTLQQKLTKRLLPAAASFENGIDTLFVVLKVDTIGRVSVVGLSENTTSKFQTLVLPAIEEVIESIPRLQPAFKTNLEVPVEVTWTLPVCLSK